MNKSVSQVDCIILCGGQGQRLRCVVSDKPKVMADFSGRPFLDILMGMIKRQGFRRFVLCTGCKAQIIEDFFSRPFSYGEIIFSRETEPLGTAGALGLARGVIKSDPFMVFNGDSFCPVNLTALLETHRKTKGAGTVVITRAGEDTSELGGVDVGKEGKVIRFTEKGQRAVKYVNAGIYAMGRKVLDLIPKKGKSSLEHDLFPQLIEKGLFSHLTEEKFYDIGTPDRLKQAQKELAKY